jgi:O-methyltransferase domain
MHEMTEDVKKETIKKVYDTLPANGVFIVIENLIDNERRQNTFGLLRSLNMLIENGDAFDYTMNDFEDWAKQAGFNVLRSFRWPDLRVLRLLINKFYYSP